LIAGYFTFGNKHIKVIQNFLATFMIFLYFGLWKIFSPTKLIQANPLILMLEENELLIDKKILQET